MSISKILAKAKGVGDSAIDKIDEQLFKFPSMRTKPNAKFVKQGDGFIMYPHHAMPQTDKTKRNWLLASLGLGGAGAAAYAMSDEDPEKKRDREIAQWLGENHEAIGKDPDIAKWIYRDWPKGFKD
jgi:hypothetical protein